MKISAVFALYFSFSKLAYIAFFVMKPFMYNWTLIDTLENVSTKNVNFFLTDLRDQVIYIHIETLIWSEFHLTCLISALVFYLKAWVPQVL